MKPGYDLQVPARPWLEWLTESALPLWTSAGWDEGTGTFVERLDLAGRPLPDVPRRVMVQARQIYVMCVAHRRGWMSGADRLADIAVRSMIRRYHAVDGQRGWIFAATAGGAVSDGRRDLYGHAFVLLALAHAATSLADSRLLDLADGTLAFLDGAMTSPHGGYVESWPLPVLPRRQNPHMHLFEALLALHEAAPDRGYLDRATAILDLAEESFVLGSTPVLVEFFDEAWRPRDPEPHAFEPGHHFEWVWLLDRYSGMGGRATDRLAASLLRVALDHGLGPSGLVVDGANEASPITGAGTRLWPQTEAAKAVCTPVGATVGAPSPELFLDGLMGRFLAPALPGSWIDQLDADGNAVSAFAPASSLYHLVCALDVYCGAASATQPDRRPPG